MSGLVELVYSEGRGLAEMIRIVLTAGGIKYNEVNIHTREDYLALKPELLFHQLPRLRIDGLDLFQSQAIVRYVARKAHLFGDSEQEAAKIDMLYEGTRDFMKAISSIGFEFDHDKIKSALTPPADKYLPIFNKVLKDNGSGFLVGTKLSVADLGLFEVLLAFQDYLGDGIFDSYPDILSFLKNLTAIGFIGKYLKEIRKPKNTPEFVAKVKTIYAIP